MAFLDNSGDIILDAVLTDTGRFRLAKGDGTFKIVKFALSDDEINYTLYNKNHPSGSAYFDLEILQSPVFEAFTNNTSTMKHKLLSIPRTNLLYLPVIQLSNKENALNSGLNTGNNGFVVSVTRATSTTAFSNTLGQGILAGDEPSRSTSVIRLDQGLNTSEISWTFDIDQDLKETQYIVEIDNRLGTIATPNNPYGNANISFIDDDNIASYYFSTNDTDYVMDIKSTSANWGNPSSADGLPNVATIKGPQGTCLVFKIRSSIDLISSDFLFDQLGASWTGASAADVTAANLFSTDLGSYLDTGGTVKYVDTTVKVTGATTGYRIDIPVRFIKCTTC